MFIANFINLLFEVLWWAIFARVMISWVDAGGRWAITRMLHDITEPLLGPIRRMLPQTGMLDLSPVIVLVLLRVIQQVVVSNL